MLPGFVIACTEAAISPRLLSRRGRVRLERRVVKLALPNVTWRYRSHLRMRRSWFTSGCAVLLLASALAACGGSDEPEQSGGTATASPDPRSPEQALLEQMVLTADDLPAGMPRLNAAFNTNEEAAPGAQGPSAELSRLQAWGRRP